MKLKKLDINIVRIIFGFFLYYILKVLDLKVVEYCDARILVKQESKVVEEDKSNRYILMY